MTKWVYDFSEGSREMRELLGGKGANVAEMTRVLGDDRVPPGFTITTEACVAYMRRQEDPEGLAEEVAEAMQRLEEKAGKRFGDSGDPLLVSVRSGARESMPGMLDTILNLGLNDEAVEGLAKTTENPRFAWDSYRRLVQMFGNVAHGVKGEQIRGCDQTGEGRSRGRIGRRARYRRAQGSWSKDSSPSTSFRKTPRPSSSTRSGPCSTPGPASGRSPTGGSTASPTTGARR